MNIAVWLTLSRVLLLPLAVIPLALNWNNGGLISASVALLAGLTDFVDGYLARMTGNITPLGTNLDFFSDKLFIGGMLIALAWLGLIPAWVPIVILTREISISAVRFKRFKWNPPSPDLLGKAKTTVSYAAIIWVALHNDMASGGVLIFLGAHLNLTWIPASVPWLVYAAVALTVISGLNYLRKYSL